jgi:hypothetical protein
LSGDSSPPERAPRPCLRDAATLRNRGADQAGTNFSVTPGRWTSYTGDAGGGTRAAFLIEHPDFALPPPFGPRVMRVLQEGLELGITDHRRAVQSYAVGRGLDIAWTEGSATLSGPGLSINIDFDALGRIGTIGGKLMPVEKE